MIDFPDNKRFMKDIFFYDSCCYYPIRDKKKMWKDYMASKVGNTPTAIGAGNFLYSQWGRDTDHVTI